jgi:RNA polymerase sigma factor (sigma-70 family)
MVRHLALARRPRLIAAARAAGAGDEAEDAVQEVLARLAAGAGRLPLEEIEAEAYAVTAVRRRALRHRPATTTLPEAPADADGPDGALERRLGVQAFADAIRDLPPQARATLVLDAAGWSRAAIAGRLGSSERAVKRVLDEERATAIARARQSLDGTECERLAATLEAFALGSWKPRADGPAARHLALCPACRAAVAGARRTRAALRSLFPPPTSGPVPVAPAAAAPVIALLAKGVAAALVGAALTVGSLHAFDEHHRAEPAIVPAVRLAVTYRVQRSAHAADAARTVPASLRSQARAARRHVRDRPFWARPRPPGSCTFGTLGICGTEQ